MLKVKICGITNLEDALFAARMGADALGFVFASSPRQIKPDDARKIMDKLPPWITSVGVFLDADPAEIHEVKRYCGFQWIQLHGHESPEFTKKFFPHVMKTVFSLEEMDKNFPCSAFLLDQKKEKTLPYESQFFDTISKIKPAKPLILAGGLTPENVEKTRTLPLYGVDVARGVESSPGKKDPDKVRQFILKAKGLS